MKLLQLKLFRDIAYEKSFVKAAQLNFITQPSVSIHLKQLEKELGVKLFDRVPRKVVLTAEGMVYLKHVEEILSKCDNLLALPGSLKESLKGEIRIASIHSIGMYELGLFLRNFMSQHPGVHIHLEYQDAFKVYELVRKKRVHLGMVAYPEKRVGIESTTYGEDELCLAVPSSHPLSQEKRVPLCKLEGEAFIAFDEKTPTRERIDQLLKKEKVKVQILMTNNNIFALKKAVESGLGISIVPWKTVDEEVRGGTISRLKITGIRIKRPLALLTLKKRLVSPVTEAFVNSLIAYNKRVE